MAVIDTYQLNMAQTTTNHLLVEIVLTFTS